MAIITGIGSRRAPETILTHMKTIGIWCLNNDIELRSGHCKGPDWFFEQGAQEYCTAYLPWVGYNSYLKSRATLKCINYFAHLQLMRRKLIFDNHANPYALNDVSYTFMSRNCHQVLGDNLDHPSNALVCYTPDGKHSGGTGFAMNLAYAFGIPIINMYKYDTSDKVIYRLLELITSTKTL